MGLFENVGLLCGNCRSEDFKASIQKFFNLADDMKSSLKESGHVLNDYLSTIFTSLNCLDILMANDRAESVCATVLSICRSIVSNDGSKKMQSPFYEKVESFIKNNPISCDDYETKIYFYAASVLIDNIGSIADDFLSEVKNNILSRVNYETVKQNYESMSRTIEENKINYLDDLLHENFIISPISMIFMQAMMLKIVDMIIYENPESKKKVFEIITEMYRKKYR